MRSPGLILKFYEADNEFVRPAFRNNEPIVGLLQIFFLSPILNRMTIWQVLHLDEILGVQMAGIQRATPYILHSKGGRV